jgi:hypothetical protein
MLVPITVEGIKQPHDLYFWLHAEASLNFSKVDDICDYADVRSVLWPFPIFLVGLFNDD